MTSGCGSSCNVTISANASIAGIIMTSGYTGTVTQSNAYTLTVGSKGWILAGGTFTGGTGTIALNGPFALHGGVFSPGAQTITATSDWTYGSGTMNPGSSTVAFYGNWASLAISGSQTFNNLKFYNNGSLTVNMTADTVLTVTGTTTLSTYNSLTLNSGTIKAQGNISAATSGWILGTAHLLIDGNANQTYTGSGGEFFKPSTTINKSGGILTLSGTISASTWTYIAGTVDPGTSTVAFVLHHSYTGPATISGSFTFNNATFSTSQTTITLASGTILTVTGTTSFSSYGANNNDFLNSGAIHAQGNINNASNGFYGTTALVINGSGNQTWTGGGFTFLPITINKTGGILTLAGTIKAGNWTYTSGNVDPGSSTVYFFAHSAWTGALTISGSLTFNNLKFYAQNTTMTFTPGTTLTAVGTTTFTSYGSAGALERLYGGAIEAQGDISTGGSPLYGTTALLIDGGYDQTWTGGGTNHLPVTINKSGGTLTLSGTITVSNWAYTGGNVDPGSSTVVFKNHHAFNGPITISGSMTFNNLTFYTHQSSITITMGTTLTVTGTTTLSSYYGAGYGETLNDGTIRAQGDVVCSNNGFAGTAAIILEGSANQTLTGGGYIGLPFTISKSGGNVQLATNFATSGNFTITAGTVNLSGKSLTVGNNKTLAIGASGILTVNGGSYSPTSGVHFSNSGLIN